jgi:DNA polymerase-3 subunit alpha
MELEKVKIVAAEPITIENETDDFIDEADAMEVPESVETETAAVVEVEEIKVVTKLTMASRKLKIKKFQMSYCLN